ncbi:MAG: type II toxin-antitoxin system RelE/ParE family toxin [Opitutales bacterium]|nr:type II toxin-antitoxin system RelE/ParE family toxin [Opitutales bacterium]
MYQVTFSDQAMGEINKLDKMKQIELIERLGAITPEELQAGKGDLGSFHRFGKNFYRLRVGDYRIYFEITAPEQAILAHYVLHKHTLADFVFRFKLPFSEETMVEQEDNFWKYLDSLKK